MRRLPARPGQRHLARWGLTGQMGDGWDGTGQLSIENAVPIAVLRTSDDQRGGHGSGPDHIGNTSSDHDFGPDRLRIGRGRSAVWLTVAVPVAVRGSRILLTAPPALVGAAPPQALGAAVRVAADEDTEDGRATADTVSKLITAYGSGDLEFVRGPGSSFTGLAGMVDRRAGAVLAHGQTRGRS